jgi:hypothetical protein
LLEDLVQGHIGVRPEFRLALAVWFQKSPESDDQYLLELMTGPAIREILSDRISLLWKTGNEGPPYANVRVASIEHFASLAATNPSGNYPFYAKL